MIRRILIEFVLPLLLFFIVRSMFGGMFSHSSPSSPARRPSDDSSTRVPPGGELKKDPVCGTYVSTASSLSLQLGKETFYFCSAQCRDRYKG